jgi:hypothetical protein
MEVNMNSTFKGLASVAIIGLSLTAGHAAELPLPPHVDLVTTPAGQLHLGMTADDVIHVMGKAARETEFAAGSTRIRKLEFVNAIPGRVILKDGKVSRVSLDAFRVEQEALPSFVKPAWMGLASSVVRRAVGEPATVLHRKFFGIEVDQWIYSRAGEGEASVFFRADRVIARTSGPDVPADLFRLELPSSPQAEGEGPMQEPRLGMTERDVRELYGPVKFRVDYVQNGQQASREIYQGGTDETSVAFTFIDGILTEFEDLGRTAADASFQGL